MTTHTPLRRGAKMRNPFAPKMLSAEDIPDRLMNKVHVLPLDKMVLTCELIPSDLIECSARESMLIGAVQIPLCISKRKCPYSQMRRIVLA
jgi:hypothetical protein